MNRHAGCPSRFKDSFLKTLAMLATLCDMVLSIGGAAADGTKRGPSLCVDHSSFLHEVTALRGTSSEPSTRLALRFMDPQRVMRSP